MYEVLLHALKHYQESGSYYERILLLQPTSPFRLPHHIESAFALFTPSDDMVVSVKESKANPYFVLFEENSEGYLEKSKQGSFIRRQDCPPVWEYNGAIYVINIQSLLQSPYMDLKTVTKFVME
jgi:N-acylneuraminate cytidylyltransferase